MNPAINKLGIILVLTVLPGCTTLGLDYFRPSITLPETFGVVALSPMKEIPTQWWTLYQDPTLNMLVEKSYKSNPDIKTAVARIEEADAQMREVGSYLFPTVDLGGNGQRNRVTEAGAFPAFGQNPRDSFDLSLRSSIELDFWGKLTRAKESARANYLSTVYAKETVELTIESLVVSSYLQIRSIDSQIKHTAKNLTVAEDALALAKRREKGGIMSMLDVHQSALVRDDLLIQTQEFKRQRRLAEHVLIILTLEELTVAEDDLMHLPLPPMPPVGLPSALLERRPDIMQAEQDLIAANANIGSAKAALYPSISLTGNYGGESLELGDLLKKASRVWSLGLSLDLPIFNAGRLDAKVDQATAKQKQALQAYISAVAKAFREVNGALVNLRQYKAIETVAASKKATTQSMLDITQNRYKAGYSAYLDVLDAKRSHIQASQAFVQNRQNTLNASVDLFKALGGGWQPKKAVKDAESALNKPLKMSDTLLSLEDEKSID